MLLGAMRKFQALGSIETLLMNALVIFGPPPDILALDENAKGICHRNGRPHIRHVIRGPCDFISMKQAYETRYNTPNHTAQEEQRQMEMPKHPKPLLQEVKNDWEGYTDQETPDKRIIYGAGPEHPSWAQRAPKHGSSEEGVVPGTGKPINAESDTR